MYHYVRPLSASEFPNIKGLELKGFERQLDFLEENYSIVTTKQVIDAVIEGKTLPVNACWLTFDDGYKDHFKYVLPELLKRNLHGGFFPPRVAIEENKVIDVNSIQHILSCASDVKVLRDKLNEACLSYNISTDILNSYYKEYGMPNRFDDADTIYIKRLLQHVLPEDIRNSITSKLFKEYVGISDLEFSNKLYMNLYEVRQLVNSGMYVGSHGSSHYWLNKISLEKQRYDIKRSLEF